MSQCMKLNEGKRCTKIKIVDFTGNSEDQTVDFSDSFYAFNNPVPSGTRRGVEILVNLGGRNKL